MIPITSLHWDQFNTKHIQKHGVTQQEVEEALTNSALILPGYSNRNLAIGQTVHKRWLTIVVDTHKPEGHYVVSARSTSRKEKNILSKILEGRENDNI